MKRRRSNQFWILSGVVVAALVLIGTQMSVAADKRQPITAAQNASEVWQKIELFNPRPDIIQQITATGGGIDAPCPQEVVTYSNHNFTSGPFTAQAGFVAQEIAAVTYTIDPIQFPIRIDYVGGLFGTQTLSQQVTVHWSLLVWQGEPNNGNLVYTITSDGKNPPHIIVGPPNNAIYLQAGVDAGDPEQIIVANNGSNKFSVGFRFDTMNNPPTQSCNFGLTPAPCCPHNPPTNIFPSTDTNGLQQSANNWIYARPGCGIGSLSGWYRFNQLGANTPSGDWNIKAAYTPNGCVTPMGACCLPSGSCLSDLTPGQCAAQGGTHQGNNTTCGRVTCPVPTGTCCLPDSTCTTLTTAQCASQGGTFMGTGVFCTTNLCKGACCIPSTQSCVTTSQNNCASANGLFQGMSTNCAGVACFGACCLPNGSCIQGVTSANCSGQGGVFQGGNTTCAQVSCPPPVGACCLGMTCLPGENQSDCVNGFGGVWQGPLTTCTPNNPCAAAPCPTDTNHDGQTNVTDLLAVINAWGPCAGCPADINHDNQVNVSDLLAVINGWGPCP